MHEGPTDPIRALAALHPRLAEAAAASLAAWSPEPPPVTIALGDLGAAVVGAEPELDDAVLVRLAVEVDRLLAASGPVADAVATGFLEAVAHADARFSARVERVVGALGPRAVGYLRAWDAFTGVVTPGLTPRREAP